MKWELFAIIITLIKQSTGNLPWNMWKFSQDNVYCCCIVYVIILAIVTYSFYHAWCRTIKLIRYFHRMDAQLYVQKLFVNAPVFCYIKYLVIWHGRTLQGLTEYKFKRPYTLKGSYNDKWGGKVVWWYKNSTKITYITMLSRIHESLNVIHFCDWFCKSN